MVTASRIDLARTALTAVPLNRALALAQWTGASRELTTTGVLRPAVAVEACRMLGIEVPSGKLRSAKDVPELDQAWAVALAADLVLVTANRASAAPGVAELVAMANRADETTEFDDDLGERLVVAWLRGAGTALGFPADAVWTVPDGAARTQRGERPDGAEGSRGGGAGFRRASTGHAGFRRYLHLPGLRSAA